MNLLSLSRESSDSAALRLEQPLSAVKQALMACIVLIWALPGLIGRDPWKPTETEVTAILKWMMESGEGLALPMLLGAPVLDTPPLYYWFAGLLAWLAPDFLELHEAARLSNIMILAVALLCIGTAISQDAHRRFAWDGMLLLVGTMGLFFDFHLLNPYLLAMAGVAMQLFGLVLLQRQTLAAGALYGVGAGIAFLSAGFIALNVSVLTVAFLALLARRSLGLPSLLSLLVASFFLFPAVGLWLTVLSEGGTAGVDAWLAADKASWFREGGVLGGAAVGAISHLTWSSWPLWPIIAIGVFTARKGYFAARPTRIGLALGLAVLAALLLSPEHANAKSYLLYPPMAFLAAGALTHLSRDALSLFDWFALLALSFVAVIIMWVLWGVASFSWPESYAVQIRGLRPGVEIAVPALNVAVAAACTLGWIGLLTKLNRGVHRPILNWSCGIALLWMLFSLLWLDYMDAGRSYRKVALNFAEAVAEIEEQGNDIPCVSSGNLFPSDASQFYYFSGKPLVAGAADCPYSLMRSYESPEGNAIELGGRHNYDGLSFFLIRNQAGDP